MGNVFGRRRKREEGFSRFPKQETGAIKKQFLGGTYGAPREKQLGQLAPWRKRKGDSEKQFEKPEGRNKINGTG